MEIGPLLAVLMNVLIWGHITTCSFRTNIFSEDSSQYPTKIIISYQRVAFYIPQMEPLVLHIE